ncbi:MAG: hypothetical protein K2O03_14295 [Lachnospiraceae bacterium]|nr:hypothetical protein [Lachnospiraceae bacterium]
MEKIEMDILFTAFCGTSAEQLLKRTGQKGLFLPNDKVLDARLLTEEILAKKYDYVFSFGQKPNIKDKIYIEEAARKNGECKKTAFDCERLAALFRAHQMEARISGNAGTSFCNSLYWNGLDFIQRRGLDVKMVFVHIPMRKNITDFEKFGRMVLEVVHFFAAS